MSKPKSISDLVMDLQQEADSLKLYKKHINALIKEEFGYSITELHKVIEKYHAMENKRQQKASASQEQGRPERANFVRPDGQGTANASPSAMSFSEKPMG